jgi:hypothetical protein
VFMGWRGLQRPPRGRGEALQTVRGDVLPGPWSSSAMGPPHYFLAIVGIPWWVGREDDDQVVC